ncbi:mCG148420 [Mus musculus]|nr:mCG148420 [Mus musculus]
MATSVSRFPRSVNQTNERKAGDQSNLRKKSLI